MNQTKPQHPVIIMCSLTEPQIRSMVQYVIHCLPTAYYELEYLNDIDESSFILDYRICVDFDINHNKKVIIKDAVIQDRDWDTLERDSFIFREYLQEKLEIYNRELQESYERAIDWENTKKSLQHI